MHRLVRARRLRLQAIRGGGVACCCSFRHPERRVEGPGRLAARTPVACSSSHRPRWCLDYARHDYVFDPSDQRVVRRDGHAVEFRDLRGDVRIALRAHAGFGFRRSEGERLHAVAPFVIPSVESRDLGGWRRARLWLAHRATAPAGASTTLGMTMFSILPISVRIFDVSVRYAFLPTINRGEISATRSCNWSLCTRTVSPVSTRSMTCEVSSSTAASSTEPPSGMTSARTPRDSSHCRAMRGYFVATFVSGGAPGAAMSIIRQRPKSSSIG